MTISSKELEKYIKSCDFLGKDLTNRWLERLPSLPASYYSLIYKTLAAAKKKVDQLYIEVELSRDPKYRDVIQGKFKESLGVVRDEKLKTLTKSIADS